MAALKRRAVSRGLAAIAALAAGVLLGSCAGSLGPVPDTLFIAFEDASPEERDAQGEDTNRELVSRLVREFSRVNPSVNIHLRHFPPQELVKGIQFRGTRGLGPDLVLSRVRPALALHRQQLSEPIALDNDRLQGIQPRFLEDFRRDDGRLLAVPLLVQPQLACFNRKRVGDPPGTLDDLLARSAQGMRVGMPLDIVGLYWTASGVEADRALWRLVMPTPGRPSDQEDLKRWLQWLANANLQRNINFAAEQGELVSSLENGDLDWISCQSGSLERLLAHLGPDLGVAPLPGHGDAPARALFRLMVWSFGTNSSPRQRQLAEDFVVFSLGASIQKTMLDEQIRYMPVVDQGQVLFPTRRSDVWAAMRTSLDHSREVPYGSASDLEPRGQAINSLLTRTILGAMSPDEMLRQLATDPRQPGPGP